MQHPPRHTQHAELQRHPSTPSGVDARIWVDVCWFSKRQLNLTYQLHLTNPRIWRLPSPCQPAPAEGLWQHSCCEAFVAALEQETAYHEFNFSPSGQWVHYAFGAERVRDPMARTGHAPPHISVGTQPQGWRITASLALDALPPSQQGWTLGLSAVLERDDGQLSYWALAHPRAAPDFHHPGGRCLRLPPPPL